MKFLVMTVSFETPTSRPHFPVANQTWLFSIKMLDKEYLKKIRHKTYCRVSLPKKSSFESFISWNRLICASLNFAEVNKIACFPRTILQDLISFHSWFVSHHFTITVQNLPPEALRVSDKQGNQELLCKGKRKAHALGEIGPQGHQKFEKIGLISINTIFFCRNPDTPTSKYQQFQFLTLL